MNSLTHQLKFTFAVIVFLVSPIFGVAAPDDVEAVPQKVAVPQNRFVMDDANFEANVFRPHANAAQAKTVLETRLRLQINEINRVSKIDAAQELKLKLAGSADIKRYFDEVDAIRKKFKQSKHDQEAWNNIWQEISPLQLKMGSGLFNDSSLFQKTMQSTLTDEQRESYEKIVMERRRFRYRATIESILTNMESSVPLRHSQHEMIANLLFEGTSPPLAFGNYDQTVVMYHLSNIPEDKLKSLLDERQWNLLQAQINQNRGMEQFLIENGIIPKPVAEVKILKAKVRRLVAQPGFPLEGEAAEDQAQVEAKK